jgi:hypothetical protein
MQIWENEKEALCFGSAKEIKHNIHQHTDTEGSTSELNAY